MTQVPHFSSRAAELLSRSRLGKTLAFQEGQGGGTAMKFVQDTGTAWLPKMLISRSKVEGAEVSLLEFGESLMIYGLPTFLGPGLGSLFSKFLGQNKGFDSKLLTQTYQTLKETGDSKAAQRAMATKAGIILTTVGGIGLWGEALVNYGKNLMTAKVFKKDSFSDVINLSQGQASPAASSAEVNLDESPQVRKAKRRIRQATVAFGGIVGSALLLARFGHRSKALQAVSEKVVKHLDFDFTEKAGAKAAYTLGNRKGLLGAIMLTCALPYLDSARDGYERLETAVRLPVVFAYVLYGQEFVQKLMFKTFPGWFKGALNDQKQVLSARDIAENALNKAQQEFKHLPEAEINAKATANMQRGLVSKGLTVALPLASGILVTGLGLGLFNRYLTAYRFGKQSSQQQPALPSSVEGGSQPAATASALRPLFQTPFGIPNGLANSVWSTHPAKPGFMGFQNSLGPAFRVGPPLNGLPPVGLPPTVASPLAIPQAQPVVTPVSYR